jgi:peptidyl-prolyl cis-trans isomerase SDCCAG10
MEITDEHSARSTQNAQDPSTIGTSKDGEGGAGDGNGEDEGMEVDDDVDWLRHRLHFATDDAAETARAEHDYEVIDPRTRGAKAKEEEMERKRAKKDGGRGYRHPPPPKRRADDGRVYDKK